ncbi:sugar ABC transporter permease [Mesorhizobium sp. YR577]|uniref:carbohydrate ABC transporter permease n=1 Tax=Mesorhizobium sp. YR577 TaxID=1884373 RepID=UPI0008E768A3|nr:sugar ABC transporter permease [Mesorhizobium sp. YR577]SFU21907.1 carbohydrate ABC transporter membrane protein 1, CUT1 family [Mesorhizobium sp. YR577]
MTIERHTKGLALRAIRQAAGGQRLRLRENIAGYLFLMPFLLGLAAIIAGPLVSSLYMSFTNYAAFGDPQWIGFDNYMRAFSDPRMWAAASVTTTYVLTAVPTVVVVALLLAVFLNRGIQFLAVYRAIFYIPSLIGGSVAVALLWRQIFGAEGLLNYTLQAIGIDHRISWIGSPDTALSTLVILQAWQFGSAMIIFLAGLRQIPQSYYEAARIDGANGIQQFFYVTLPMLAPVILFNTVMSMIGAFQAFNSAYIISSGSGGPADSTLFFTLYLYQQGFVNFDFGYASALGWLLILVVATATAVLLIVTRRWIHYGEDA